MNLYLSQENQNSSISLTSCYLLKIIPKSNCKHVPVDGVVRAQSKCEIRKCFTYWGGDGKKNVTNVTGTVKVFKKDQ